MHEHRANMGVGKELLARATLARNDGRYVGNGDQLRSILMHDGKSLPDCTIKRSEHTEPAPTISDKPRRRVVVKEGVIDGVIACVSDDWAPEGESPDANDS